MGNEHDWQKNKNKDYPYLGDVDNKEYLEDRAKVFKENGNGWWWLQGTYGYGKKKKA
jgi:hypothetical protein|tara:strand:- start:11646 stop:11816 length:171 start_codon:yes stop_codon:yes gene_type:complete